jgi:1,4-dihydroxy-2-naphthoyl-CoA hydrolase
MTASGQSLEMPFANLLGIEITKSAKEHVTAKMLVRPELCTVGGVIHGGALMAFADSTGAIGTVLNLRAGERTATLESKTNFLRGAKTGQTLISNTTPVHIGGSTHVWQTRIETEEGKLVAIVTQTQMILQPTPGPSGHKSP